jgi:hypothetical protein
MWRPAGAGGAIILDNIIPDNGSISEKNPSLPDILLTLEIIHRPVNTRQSLEHCNIAYSFIGLPSV